MANRRRQAGLDIARASARLGISMKHLQAVERGQVPLSWRLAEKMAVEYSIGLSDLIRFARLTGASGTGKKGAAAGPAAPHTSKSSRDEGTQGPVAPVTAAATAAGSLAPGAGKAGR